MSGVSSIEEVTGSRPTYQCCTFRGSVVALKVETGAQIWKAYTIPEAPHPTKSNAIGTQLFGPAGASVWSAPTIDVSRKALYVATSNSYSDPATSTSDAILAFDLATGRMLWHRQATPKDSFVVACFGTDQTNCPEDHGPDHDFGQSPILVSLRNGQSVLVIGQKSGVVHALDPDQEGKILWQTRIGKGGPLGGSEWGSAADQDRVYVANSDVQFLRDGTRRLNPNEGGGLFALDLATGKIEMQVAPVGCGERSQCSPALSAAITLIPGVVFSGGVSGYLRLCDGRCAAALGDRHGARIHNGEWRFGPWWRHGRARADRRQWHAVRQFWLRAMGRSARQRSAGIRGRESLTNEVSALAPAIVILRPRRLLAPLYGPALTMSVSRGRPEVVGRRPK